MAKYYESRMDGKYWNEQRKSVLKRDGCCVKCGNTDANVVHHIIPRKEFELKENAHDLNNLLTVCRTPCHWELEDLPVKDQREFLP